MSDTKNFAEYKNIFSTEIMRKEMKKLNGQATSGEEAEFV